MNIDLMKLLRMPSVQEVLRRESSAFEETITRKRFALLDDLDKVDRMIDDAELECVAARKRFEDAQEAMFAERGKLGNVQRKAEGVKARRSLIEKQLFELGEGHVIYGENRAATIKRHLESEMERIRTARPAPNPQRQERADSYRAKVVADLAVAERVNQEMLKLRHARLSPMELTEAVDNLLSELGIAADGAVDENRVTN